MTKENNMIKAWNALKENASFEGYKNYNPIAYDYTFGRKNSSWPNAMTHIVTKDEYQLQIDIRGDRTLPLAIRVPGGPGSALTSDYADYFSKNMYSMVRCDWRGIGTSVPAGPGINNTTQHCLSDLETLRHTAGGQTWTMMGSSWGSCMALQYTTRYRNNVSGLVLGLPFLGQEDDMWWGFSANGLYQHQSNYLPNTQTQTSFSQSFERLYHEADIKDQTRYDKVLSYYAEALTDKKNPQRQKQAYLTWADYELSSSGEGMTNEEKRAVDFNDPKHARHLSRAQIMADYFANKCYLNPKVGGLNGISQNIIGDLPVCIIAHKHDPLAHPDTVEKIHKTIPHAEIVMSDANWHWLYNDKNDPFGRSNEFARQGYAYATTKLALISKGHDLDINPGIHYHNIERKPKTELHIA